MSNNSPIDKNKFPHILDALNQEHWYLTKLLVLLIIISVASMGSFSLAQHLLPSNAGPTITPAPTYLDGVCDANPDQMTYIPILGNSGSSNPNTSSTPSNVSPTIQPTPKTGKNPRSPMTTNTIDSSNGPEAQPLAFMSSAHPQVKPSQSSRPSPTPPPATPTPNPLPPGWYADGFTDNDVKYAQACAATFVKKYHTFNANDPNSFTTAIYMLSAYAQKLYYQGGPDDTHHLHLHRLPNWQNQVQQFQETQEASVDKPTLLSITPQYSKFVVYVDVGYTLSREISGQVSTSAHHDKVTLQNTSPSPKLLPDETTGWQVIDWQDGDAS